MTGFGVDLGRPENEGGPGTSLTGGGGVGVGGDAHSNGTYHVGDNISGALGIKGDLGADISVNPSQVENTVSSVGNDIASGAEDAVATVGSWFS